MDLCSNFSFSEALGGASLIKGTWETSLGLRIKGIKSNKCRTYFEAANVAYYNND
jgi:hypothetical protein